jgi:multisubunit Na+/H+ antiporter MnhF subunit
MISLLRDTYHSFPSKIFLLSLLLVILKLICAPDLHISIVGFGIKVINMPCFLATSLSKTLKILGGQPFEEYWYR